jgi:hypothetical protein
VKLQLKQVRGLVQAEVKRLQEASQQLKDLVDDEALEKIVDSSSWGIHDATGRTMSEDQVYDISQALEEEIRKAVFNVYNRVIQGEFEWDLQDAP